MMDATKIFNKYKVVSKVDKYYREQRQPLLDQLDKMAKEGKGDTEEFVQIEDKYIKLLEASNDTLEKFNNWAARELGCDKSEDLPPLTHEELRRWGFDEDLIETYYELVREEK